MFVLFYWCVSGIFKFNYIFLIVILVKDSPPPNTHTQRGGEREGGREEKHERVVPSVKKIESSLDNFCPLIPTLLAISPR